MAVNKPRNRTLLFRLTEDEYEWLQTAATGARSLSDFARERLLGSAGRPPIEQQLNELKLTVERIAELLEKD
jgi:uncharacterized protein (DUF1778 family)